MQTVPTVVSSRSCGRGGSPARSRIAAMALVAIGLGLQGCSNSPSGPTPQQATEFARTWRAVYTMVASSCGPIVPPFTASAFLRDVTVAAVEL